MRKSLVGCCFQRTIEPNTHKTTPCQKAFFALSAKLFYLPIFINGALKTAPYGIQKIDELCRLYEDKE